MPHGDRLLGTAEGREPCASADGGGGAAAAFSGSVDEAAGFAAGAGEGVGAGAMAGDGAATGDGVAASGACAKADDANAKLNPIAASVW